MHNIKFIFMLFALENKCKNFEFLIIMDFYTLFLKEMVYKSFIHDA